ncbi:class II aminotransferase/8-amino-7-oxononanoate synthase [Xylariaceae sp. AK1471]|nr:class II aminotransferase/8-amino-7-oxononanoate synthase [Xylariaceae sp. AK1471]
MATPSLLSAWHLESKPKAPALQGAPVFYRNLEQVLDQRRETGSMLKIPRGELSEDVVDLVTMDFLSLTKSGVMRTLYLEEEAKNPEFKLHMGASRLMKDSPYFSETEDEVAALHGAETALLFRSGWDAKNAILMAVPRPGDVLLYDELVHASLHDGMQLSLASARQAFKHNDVDNFRESLMAIKERESLIRDGSRCVLIIVESEYSMEGDITPLAELVAVAKEIFPDGNAQFIIDEAHSTGVLGKLGKGLVSSLGLEKDIAIRMHSFTKALACAGGAAVFCNETVRSMMVNFARVLIYSHPPQFGVVSSIRVASRFMASVAPPTPERGEEVLRHADGARRIRRGSRCGDPVGAGSPRLLIARVPVAHNISYIMTRQRYTQWLYFHLQLRGYKVLIVDYPVVPKGTSRVRLVFKAHLTDAQIEGFVDAVCEWALEMLELEAMPRGANKVPSVARQVYAFRDTEAAVA